MQSPLRISISFYDPINFICSKILHLYNSNDKLKDLKRSELHESYFMKQNEETEKSSQLSNHSCHSSIFTEILSQLRFITEHFKNDEKEAEVSIFSVLNWSIFI